VIEEGGSPPSVTPGLRRDDSPREGRSEKAPYWSRSGLQVVIRAGKLAPTT
jgi:hypothetical protein